jgi:hypothetical protein
MADPSLFDRLRTFVNDDTRFRRFLESCNGRARRRGELTFSQERLWESFVAANPEFADSDFDTIVSTFAFCHVHLVPLQTVQIPIRKDLIDEYFAPEYESQLVNCPYSAQYVYDSPAWGDRTHIDSLHCDECIAFRQRIGT